MNISKVVLVFFSLFIVCLPIIAEETENDDWVSNYINLDPSDDFYHGYTLKNHKISKEYVKDINWRQDIDFFIDSVDELNLRQNVNILPHIPYTWMLYGGYNYNRGIDIGFLFRADNIANSGLAFTTAFSFGQNTKLWLHTNLEYTGFFDNRLKILQTFSFFTTGPQYSSRINKYKAVQESIDDRFSSLIMRTANKIWGKFGLDFVKQNEMGFHFISGIDYRIPVFELNSITTVEMVYDYIYSRDVSDRHLAWNNYEKAPEEDFLKMSTIGLNIRQEFRWNRFKQTQTIPVGNNLSLITKFYLPTKVGIPNYDFRFKFRIEERFNKKIFREYAVKSRLILAANYNISEDYSGDPYVRGLADYELTGWFALLGNIELLVPLLHADFLKGPDLNKPFRREAKFIVYWAFFADGGFTIENENYYLDNFYERPPKDHIANNFILNGDKHEDIPLGNDHYLIPAFSVGTGFHFFPYFLHFLFRLDFSFNILKAAIYSNNDEYKNQFLEITFSFNQTF